MPSQEGTEATEMGPPVSVERVSPGEGGRLRGEHRHSGHSRTPTLRSSPKVCSAFPGRPRGWAGRRLVPEGAERTRLCTR